MEQSTESEKDLMSEDEQKYCDSDFSSEDECVDVLSHEDDDADVCVDKSDNICEASASNNKFSIDSILGLTSKETKESEKCNRQFNFIKPTPVPATSRGGKDKSVYIRCS